MRSSLRANPRLTAAGALLFILLQAHALIGRVTIVAPGIAVRLDEVVTVHGSAAGHSGAFLATAVYAEPAGLLSLIYAAFDTSTDLSFGSIAESIGSGTYRSAIEFSMLESQESAKVVALRACGYRVPERRGLAVRRVDPAGPFAGRLQPGDIILGIDGVRVGSPRELNGLLGESRGGDAIEVELDRRGKALTYAGRLPSSPSGGQSVMGIDVSPRVLYQFPVAIDIDSLDIRGSSAGLMFALEIYSQLSGNDLTRRRVAAGTGVLDSEGGIWPVSGVKQKAIAARRWGADMFIVPPANLAEARVHAGTMKVIAAASFGECVRALRKAK